MLADDSPVVPLFFARAAFPFRPAVYDGWRLTRGGDLLDKASFIGARAEKPTSRERIPPDPIDDLGKSGDGGLSLAVLVLAACVAAGVAVALWRIGRRPRGSER